MPRLALAIAVTTLLPASFTAQAHHFSTSPISSPGCTGAVTSTGFPATCEVFGNSIASANDAQLVASGLPANQFVFFFTGLADVPPMTVNSGNGWVCINPAAAGGFGRFAAPNQIKNSGPLGTVTLDTNAGEWTLASIPSPWGNYAAVAGRTSYFEAWFRDPVGAGYNFTGSAVMTWQ